MSEKYKRAVWPEDTADRIKAMRERREPWRAVAASFGVDIQAVRHKAKQLGVFVPSNRYFTPKEDAIIREGYLAQRDLYELAASMGRARENIYQRAHRKMPEILNTVRTGRVTRAVKQYGRGFLKDGENPNETLDVLKAKIITAKAAARVAAITAKTNRSNAIIATMLEQIAAGKDRDSAIFEARMVGVSLERIASCFDITRERVRQICDAEAFRMTLEPALNHEPAPVKRDYILVAGGKP